MHLMKTFDATHTCWFLRLPPRLHHPTLLTVGAFAEAPGGFPPPLVVQRSNPILVLGSVLSLM